MDDIDVSIVLGVEACDCCGMTKLKRAIHFEGADFKSFNLGVKCAGEHFNLNLTGNPYKAAAKLGRMINSMDTWEFMDILDNIIE